MTISTQKEIKDISKYQKLFLMALFAIFIIVGFSIAGDYGVPWDDHLQISVGEQNYNLAINGNKDIYSSPDKYYGSAFELPLYILQSFSKSYINQIYTRHIVTHLFFILSLFFFFKLLLKIFNSYSLAILGVIILYLSPVIFAHSFFNTKDIPFLSAFIISIYTMLSVYENPYNNNRILLHALASAFLMDIRIIGILIPILTLFFWILPYILHKSKVHSLKQLLIYFILLIPFTLTFWPSLWYDPLIFLKSILRMSQFPWNYTNLFNGSFINANEIPWYYIPTWVSITSPIAVILLYLIGSIHIFRKTIQHINNRISLKIITVYILVFIPIDLWILFIIINSVFYDGWRHLFFLYPLIIIGSIYGIIYIRSIFPKNIMDRLVYALLVLILLSPIISIVKLHPYQHIYFNKLISKENNSIRQNWEIDYWGLSYKEGFEKLKIISKGNPIFVKIENSPGIDNCKLVDENKTNFVIVDSISDADYFITNYRFHPQEYNYNKIDSIYIQGSCILGIYKLKNN